VEVPIRYGSGAVTFEVPSGSVAGVLRPRPPAATGAPVSLAQRLEGQLDRAEANCAGRDLLVLVADGTRDQAHAAAYAALGPLLAAARTVRVVLATGTHQTDTPDNRGIADEIAGVSARLGVPLSSVEAHDCHASETYGIGTTSRGNRVLLNRRVADAQAVLIVSDMRPHYFAGYSNATKFLLPGVAAFASIERDHAWALDPLAGHCRHPLHPDPARRRNPVAENQLEAARRVAEETPVYALGTVTADRRVLWAAFGEIEQVVSEGIASVDAHLVARVRRPARRVVIGCGGYPNDETLYIAQRSLELTKEAVADGAEVVWLAACANGIASSERAVRAFFEPLHAGRAAYVRRVRERYVMFSHKTVKFVEMLERLGALHVKSELPPDRLPPGMTPCDDPRQVVSAWVERGERVLFIEDANTLAVMLSAAVPGV